MLKELEVTTNEARTGYHAAKNDVLGGNWIAFPLCDGGVGWVDQSPGTVPVKPRAEGGICSGQSSDRCLTEVPDARTQTGGIAKSQSGNQGSVKQLSIAP
jgi:hypothetical protein